MSGHIPFLIAPPWMEVGPKPGDIKIIIDPGVVFETGLHPTTKDCLRAMVTLQEGQIPMEKVLDLGTGTGILALAAGFLGAWGGDCRGSQPPSGQDNQKKCPPESP